MTLEEFWNALPARRERLANVPRCAQCGVALQESVTGNRRLDDGHVCSDCYFRVLGEEIEQHPVFAPRSVRGV